MVSQSLVDRIGRRRLAIAAAAVLVVVLAIQAVVKHDAEWAQVFVESARRLWRGEDFLAPGTLYLYPPFGALAGLPFAPLPDWGVRLAFFAVNLAAIAALARAAWALAVGPRFEPTRDQTIIAALGLVVAVPFAWNTLLHQQADLVIDALVALGMAAALARRSLLAGVLIGLGAAFKGPPLLFAVYFLWRRDFLAAFATVATAIGVNLLPDLVARAPDGLWVGLWLKRWVLPATGADAALGSWGTMPIFNQSLAGTMQRLFNTRLVVSEDGIATVAAPFLATHPLKLLTYGAMAAMALATLVASWIGDRRRPADPSAEREARAIELAMVAPMMLLFSPMSGLAHFPIVAPAALLLAVRAVRRRDAAAAVPLAVAALCALAVNKDLVGHRLYDTVMWSGAATLCALALWAGCLVALLRPLRPAQTASP